MASKEQYAYWCTQLLEGDDYFVAELYMALREDEYINESDEWTADVPD